MTSPGRNPLVRLGVAAGALAASAGLVAAGAATGVEQPKPVAAPQASGARVAVCPTPAGSGATSEVVSDATAATAGDLVVRHLDGGELQTVPAGSADRFVVSDGRPVAVQARGGAAPGSASGVLALAERGPDRGLSLANCVEPVTEAWFVGLRSDPGARSALVLSNPDDSQAQVDLRFLSGDGLQVVPGGRGITVPAHTTRTVALESLLTSNAPVAVQVRATAGRISPVARLQLGDAVTPAGADWHAGSVLPVTDLVVAGVPGGPGRRELVVANPGQRRAVVAVEAMGASGSFAPAGADTVEVDGESVATVALDPALDGEPVSVRLRSNQPVTAAVQSSSADTPAANDVAVQPATDPLAGLGLAPVAAAAGQSATLLLGNDSAEPTDVRWSAVDGEGRELAAGTQQLAAGGSAPVPLPAGDRVAVRVEPDTGSRVHAAVVLTGQAPGLTTLATAPLVSPDRAAHAVAPRFDPRVG